MELTFEKAMAALSVLLLASASVERFLEFLDKAIESLGLFSRKKKGKLALREKEEGKVEPPQVADPQAEDALGAPEGDPSSMVLLEEGEAPNRQVVIKRFITQIGGCALGIGLCFQSKLGLFAMFKAPLGTSSFLSGLDFILTGILIGAGTDPIHSLIRFLEEKREASKAEATQAEEQPVEEKEIKEAPEILIAKSVIDIEYFGGLEPEKQAYRKRKQNPDMIVFHHTGTHSNTSFQEVVRVSEARGFPTGFHSVVTSDGKYYHYCRWDGRGIHAKGYNERSLGLAFVGCFESNPAVAGANVNGRLGNLIPTDAQLLTGAKIIALWMLLYGIEWDPEEVKIVPHRTVALTACPGENFPYHRFKRLVIQLSGDWQNSSKALGELEDFRKKPYLFV